jgi:hypothetical protein
MVVKGSASPIFPLYYNRSVAYLKNVIDKNSPAYTCKGRLSQKGASEFLMRQPFLPF